MILLSNEIKCEFCHKMIEPAFEDGRTTVPDISGDKIVDMGSWWYCPECNEDLPEAICEKIEKELGW